MRYVLVTLSLAFLFHQGAMFTVAAGAAAGPSTFEEMADEERAFARRAQEVAVSQAFTEFFAPDAVGFASGQPASAQAELRRRPAGPRDPGLLFWWEPRTGDIAASGDLGWLTGPVRMGRTGQTADAVRHGNYASIWKRQPDGRLRVVIDIGIDPPGEVPFAPGLTRLQLDARYTGSEIEPLARASLQAADRALNAAARTALGPAFGQVAAPAVRVHRNGHLPFAGREAALAWLQAQAPFAAAESLYAETARSADLGYTWGSYETAAVGQHPARAGHYARVWARGADGAWRLALDLDAPKPARP